MPEWLDIYDENLQKLGVKEREAVHRDGNWHRTFDAWLVNPKGAVLFQLRSQWKSDSPLLFDTSAAGHYLTGESPVDGVREIKEELGLTVSLADLIPMGMRTKTSRSGNRIDNEFQDIFMLPLDPLRQPLCPNASEVAAYVWIPLEMGLEFFSGVRNVLRLAVIAHDGMTTTQTLIPSAFVPAKDRYYLKVFIMAERLLQGHRDLAV